MKRMFLSILTPVLVLALANLAPAMPRDGHGGPEGGPPGRFFEENAEELGLGDETLEAIHGVLEGSRERAEELHRKVREARKALHDALETGEPDEATVMKAAEKVGEAKTALRKHRLRTMLRVRNELTPEQRKKLVELRTKRLERGPHGRVFKHCREDVDRLCSDVEPGPDRGHCLHEHRDELSEACQAAIHDMARQRRHHPPPPDE